MNKLIRKAAQGAGKLVHQAGSKKAWADHKAGYLKKEGGQKEYDMEKGEFYYNKDKAKLKLIPTDDGEVQDRSGIEDWQLAPSRKSSPINHCSSDMMHSQSWNEMRKRSNVKSPLNMIGLGVSRNSRCWEGYEPTPGVKAYDKGSCRKK